MEPKELKANYKLSKFLLQKQKDWARDFRALYPVQLFCVAQYLIV